MTIQFATCCRTDALRFIQRYKPDITEADIADLLSLVDADVVRITDPMMHNHAAVVPGTHYTPDKRDAILAACKPLGGAK